MAQALGWDWPLTVSEAEILCAGSAQLALRAGDTDYSLNGLAKGTGEHADIDPIWKADPVTEGLKVDISGLISYGNVACGYPS